MSSQVPGSGKIGGGDEQQISGCFRPFLNQVPAELSLERRGMETAGTPNERRAHPGMAGH